jgi:Fe-Mn family superoxide dismutase
MAIVLPDLPYAKNALEPYIGAQTMELHHDKHHAAYVNNTNKLIAGTDLEGADLDKIVKKVAGDSAKVGLFNNAAQAWNHMVYWHCMKPGGGGKPTGDIAKLIDRDLGGYEKFVEDFKNAGMTQFGSGWAWLVLDGGKLKITKTSNAFNPLVDDHKALIAVDVWEHSYYLDYQNKRGDYLTAFVDHLINWDYVNSQL